jgi:hypothetical protein
MKTSISKANEEKAAQQMFSGHSASRVCNLTIHTSSHSSEDLILNPDFFSDFSPNELIQIYTPEKFEDRLVVRVPPSSNVLGRIEISLLKSIADSINLKQFNKVIVERISERDAALDFVELSFRRQYLQRGHMLRFKNSLVGRTIHVNQNIQLNSMTALVQDVRKDSNPKVSGLITEQTKFVFRSKSARIIWLVQISAEMWDIDQVRCFRSNTFFPYLFV